MLVMHGEDDQIVPIADSALLSAKLAQKCGLKAYPGLPLGMGTTHADIINADLLAFFTSCLARGTACVAGQPDVLPQWKVGAPNSWCASTVSSPLNWLMPLPGIGKPESEITNGMPSSVNAVMISSTFS